MIAISKEDNRRNKPDIETSKTGNIIKTFGPIFMFENIFGVFRFSKTDNTLKPTTGLLKLFGIIVTIIIVILYVILFDLINILTEKNDFIRIIRSIPHYAILIQYVSASVITSCWLSDYCIRIMTSLADLDTTIHVNKSWVFYRKLRNHAIIATTAAILLNLMASVSDVVADYEESIYPGVLDYLLSCQQDIETVLFCLMINSLNIRLQVVNHHLLKIIYINNDQEKISLDSIRKQSAWIDKKLNVLEHIPLKNLHKLCSAYEIIGDISQVINIVCNFQLFTVLITAFLYIITTLWSGLYFFRAEFFTSGYFGTLFLWCASDILAVTAMAMTCENFLSTRDHTKVLVNELVMDYKLPASARAQAKVFMELIDIWPLRIYIYDMFSVDITLMLKFISISTTYLIIIIQISHFM